MKRDGYLLCAQPVCVMATRTIYPADKWCAGHDDSGTRYIGPVHFLCNSKDGARLGRQRQGDPVVRRWTV